MSRPSTVALVTSLCVSIRIAERWTRWTSASVTVRLVSAGNSRVAVVRARTTLEKEGCMESMIYRVRVSSHGFQLVVDMSFRRETDDSHLGDTGLAAHGDTPARWEAPGYRYCATRYAGGICGRVLDFSSVPAADCSGALAEA